MNMYIGTYTTGKSKGIYNVDYERGLLENSRVYYKTENPKYLQVAHRVLFSIFENEVGAGVTVIKDGICLDELVYDKIAPCYLIVDGFYIYTANYHEGKVAKLLYRNHKLHFIKEINFGAHAGCHQVIIHNNQLLIPCLKLNKVIILNKELQQIGIIDLPFQSGPRHGVIYDNHLYLLCELSNDLYIFDIVENEFFMRKVIKLVENQPLAHAAGICVDEANGLVFASVRHVDRIFVIHAKSGSVLGNYYCQGKEPRFIAFDKVNRTLIVCNRQSNNIASLQYAHDNLEITSNIIVDEPICASW